MTVARETTEEYCYRKNNLGIVAKETIYDPCVHKSEEIYLFKKKKYIVTIHQNRRSGSIAEFEVVQGIILKGGLTIQTMVSIEENVSTSN